MAAGQSPHPVVDVAAVECGHGVPHHAAEPIRPGLDGVLPPSGHTRKFRDLDEWFRRRLRQIRWKEWKRVRTKVANLRALGIRADLAWQWGMSSRGYWRIAGSPVLTRALPNRYWDRQGLITFHHAWARFHTT
ncbi:hypothetical protein MBOU_37260 [Mycobacterium bourgelatii]|uniref:Maturase n=1 Tax=Mycobacterium bourgelatii TaxID=1273442 RepID=A0A7I9YSL2_MYCBU|nr:hypothetical protein MBOU_37260 [Mycobacterium bourgelatii]